MSKKTGDVIWVGLALFAMFFGAGNLIFPPFLGFLAGPSWPMAMLGFLITGIGMPLLGIMASSRAGGTVEHLAGRVSPLFGRILSIVIILAIGPLLAIPRTAATTFEMGVRPNFPGARPPLSSSVVYFAVTLFFALNQKKVVDEIGKILTPFLVGTLALIILKGVFFPLGDARRSRAAPTLSARDSGRATRRWTPWPPSFSRRSSSPRWSSRATAGSPTR